MWIPVNPTNLEIQVGYLLSISSQENASPLQVSVSAYVKQDISKSYCENSIKDYIYMAQQSV